MRASSPQESAAAGTAFDRLLRRAHDAVVRDGLAEAIYVLRIQIRSTDATASRRSAEVMARIAAAERRDRLQRERLKLQAAAAERRDRLARERLKLGDAAKEPERAEDLFPDTPLGRQARGDWACGVMEREYAEALAADPVRAAARRAADRMTEGTARR